jgi:hypothetical protein
MKTQDMRTVTALGGIAGENDGLKFAREVESEMQRMGYLDAPKPAKNVVEPRKAENDLTYGNESKPS